MKYFILMIMSLISEVVFASSEKVSFTGAKGEGYPYVENVTATLQIPDGGIEPMPAVVLLHGSAGIDGRGAFHAEALNKAGIATLEVYMFDRDNRPKGGHTVTLTHAYGALNYLANRTDIDPKKIGVMGFSWGGNLSLRTASKSVHRAFFPQGTPAFAAHAPYYAVWWVHIKLLKDETANGYGDYSNLTGAPILLFAGGQDDYGAPDAARQFLDALPEAARKDVALEFYPDATHGWDSPPGSSRTIFDPYAHDGKGGRVRFQSDSKLAEDARDKTVEFFRKTLDVARK